MSRLFEYYGITKKKGEVIFSEGDLADYLYLIHQGKVQISKKVGEAQEKILVLGEGEFVGEMAVINEAPRSATAVAVEDCELISMDRESFNSGIRENHKFAVSVIEMLSDRLRETDDVITDMVSKYRREKLFSEIVTELVNRGKRDASGQWTLVPFDSLWEKAITALPWGEDFIRKLLDEIVNEGTVSIKRGSGGKKWIGCRREK